MGRIEKCHNCHKPPYVKPWWGVARIMKRIERFKAASKRRKAQGKTELELFDLMELELAQIYKHYKLISYYHHKLNAVIRKKYSDKELPAVVEAGN